MIFAAVPGANAAGKTIPPRSAKSVRAAAPRHAKAAKRKAASGRTALAMLQTSTAPKLRTVSPGASWPMFRGNVKHTAFTPINVNVPLTPAWTWQGDAVAIASSPAIVDGVVYIGTRDDAGGTKGSLLAIDLSTGKLKWRYNVSDKARTIMTHTAKVQPLPTAGANTEALAWVDSTPCVSGNMVYVMSRDGALHALTTAGVLKWRLRTGGLDTSSPTIVNGTIYVGSGYPNKDFWAVDAVSGVVKWRTNSGLADPLLKRPGQYVYSSQAFADGIVYASANDGGFYGLNATTGKLKWRYETQGGVYFHSPCLAGTLLIGAPGDYDTAVYGINRTTGELAWKYVSGLQHSYVSSPAYDGDTAYVGIGEPDQEIVALNAQTGTLKWKYVTGYATQNSYTSSPAVTNNVIFVGTAQAKRGDPESGRVVALDKASGSVLWQTSLPKPVLSSPSVAGNYVVVGCMDGTVRAFTWTP
ncbi:MAG TPA: PQQ-binding-like beta-propeller repeat protein [Armatimonadota bacterium]|jgi:outer membrane protein assembly factor BamB